MRSLLSNEFMKWRRTVKPYVALGLYTTMILIVYAVLMSGEGSPEAASFFGFATMGAIAFLSIFTIVFTAEMIGNELKFDTLKHLLMSPYSRDRILLSKLIMSIWIVLIQFAFILLVAFAFSLTLDGSVTWETLRPTLLSISGPIFIIFLTLMFSVVFKSVGVVIGFTVLANFASGIIGGLLVDWKPELAKWIVFLHTDFSIYDLNPGFMDAMNATLGFSIFYVLLHIIAFYLIAAFMFRSKTFAE